MDHRPGLQLLIPACDRQQGVAKAPPAFCKYCFRDNNFRVGLSIVTSTLKNSGVGWGLMSR